MGRVHIQPPVPALALRRPEAAAALGVSVEIFDELVRPNVPVVRLRGVTVYPLAGLHAWLQRAQEAPATTQTNRRTAA